MEDIYNWPALLEDAKALLFNKTRLPISDKEKKNYRTQNGTPKFTFGIKTDKVVCLWVGNFRKDRLGRPKKDSTCTIFSVADEIAYFRYTSAEILDDFTPREWDCIGKELLRLRGKLRRAGM